METKIANVSRAAFSENYTNEWGAHNTVRFLKISWDVVDPGSCSNAGVRIQLRGIGRTCCKRKATATSDGNQ